MYMCVAESCCRHRREKGEEIQKEREGRRRGHGELCAAGNIDACKKIFMDFRDHSRVKLVARGNIFPFVCVYMCTEMRTENVYLPPPPS